MDGDFVYLCMGSILLCVGAPGRECEVLDYCAAQLFRGQLAVLNSTQTSLAGASRLSCATTQDPVYVCTRWMYRTCQIS